MFGPHFFPFSEDDQDDNNEDKLGNATVVLECLDLNDDDNSSSLNDDNDDDDNDGARQRQQEEDEEEKEEEDSFIFSTMTNNYHDADSVELPCHHKSGSERSLLAKTHSDSQVTTALSLPEPQLNNNCFKHLLLSCSAASPTSSSSLARVSRDGPLSGLVVVDSLPNDRRPWRGGPNHVQHTRRGGHQHAHESGPFLCPSHERVRDGNGLGARAGVGVVRRVVDSEHLFGRGGELRHFGGLESLDYEGDKEVGGREGGSLPWHRQERGSDDDYDDGNHANDVTTTTTTTTATMISHALRDNTRQWTTLKNDPRIHPIVIMNGFYLCAISGSQMTLLPLLLTGRGPTAAATVLALTAMTMGQILMWMSAVQVLGNPAAGALADRAGKRTGIMAGGC
ncbi:hypothetical protein ACHAXS_009036 [Conticribra weissflogii]